MPSQFIVGLKLKGRTDHFVVAAEDALIAALKVKVEHPEAIVAYVRPMNKRGDARHLQRTAPRERAKRDSGA